MQVTQIQNTLLQSASYLIDGCFLVDCGDYLKAVELIKKHGNELNGIFLTHCHQDHVYGLCDILKHYPTAKVFCSELTAIGLKDEEMNLSYIIPEYLFKFVFEENVVLLQEGKHYVKGMELEAIATPGHSDDCYTYIIGQNIFTGDSYIPFARVFTKWPRSNKKLALENELMLKHLAEERKLNVCSGHWD